MFEIMASGQSVPFFVFSPPHREPREDGLAKMWDRAAADIARRTGRGSESERGFLRERGLVQLPGQRNSRSQPVRNPALVMNSFELRRAHNLARGSDGFFQFLLRKSRLLVA